jgi:hypothetical protein
MAYLIFSTSEVALNHPMHYSMRRPALNCSRPAGFLCPFGSRSMSQMILLTATRTVGLKAGATPSGRRRASPWEGGCMWHANSACTSFFPVYGTCESNIEQDSGSRG